MTIENPDISVPNPEHEEHSKAGRAKRVIAGALPMKFENGESIGGVQAAPGTELALETGKAYRVISDGDFYLKVGKTGVAATNVDYYVPAGQEILVRMVNGADTIKTLAGPSGGTFVQAVEVQ